ncbi:prolipoprotein diacylglyceryl transferase [Deinococcus misasensis]|uniref:prolipoprotein diacylglyceryl transferase n=1 Tax=Deinococcus misasensis TaxID=392413 RepID=UPI00054F2694|nr:prolipoprotein diacylglyceryl transferase [Deinococcus misasensis]
MDPIFIQIGSFSIAWYGVLMMAGIMGGAILAQRLAVKKGLNANLISDIIFWAVIWGVIGARVLFVMTSPEAFAGITDPGQKFLAWVNIRTGGLSIHGGLLFGIAVFLYYQWRYKINFYEYASLLAPGLGLGIMGGRLGNIMNGSDTVGRPTNLPIGFVWPDWAKGFHNAMCNANNPENLAQYCTNGLVTVPVHFTQLYGVLIGLLIFVLAWNWMKTKTAYQVFYLTVMWYSILRSVVEETFRLNPLTFPVYETTSPNEIGIGLFTLTQVASVVLVIWCIIMLMREPKEQKPVKEQVRA